MDKNQSARPGQFNLFGVFDEDADRAMLPWFS